MVPSSTLSSPSSIPLLAPLSPSGTPGLGLGGGRIGFGALAPRRALPVEERPGVLRGIQASIDRVPPNFSRMLTRRLRRGALTRPGFSGCWVNLAPPDGAELLTEYPLGRSQVRLYRVPEQIDILYHLDLADYRLTEAEVELLHRTRDELVEYYPKHLQITSLSQTRHVVHELSLRFLQRVSRETGIVLPGNSSARLAKLEQLSEVLTRHVVGFGVLEVLLADPHVQDLYVDAPASENRVHLRVGGFGRRDIGDKCITNVTVTDEEAEALLARLLVESGRPFSESMPVLETDLREYAVRATVIGRPLSPDGIAMALRRHATDPWTLTKFVYLQALTPMAAGLLSFLIDGRSTILVAGARGAGKTSLVGALMLEFPKTQRILTIEDTLELPSVEMRQFGYKVQTIFVRSSVGGQTEMSAEDALKVSLRLGESAIVLGEVRGQEARTLYEAMRAGTAGSAVLGTIHGNSSRAIFERVVHDIGISATSFNATDIVVVSGLTNPGGSVRSQRRRVLEVSEVAKEAGTQPGTFRELLLYDEASDALLETPAIVDGSDRIKRIAQAWGLTYDEAMENVRLRGRIREKLVEVARDQNRMDVLSAPWVASSNAAFWELLERHAEEIVDHRADYDALYSEWLEWLRGALAHG